MTALSAKDIQALKAIGRIREEKSGWSLDTADQCIAAQLDHAVIVTNNKPIRLTA